jgi:hypothetical protein
VQASQSRFKRRGGTLRRPSRVPNAAAVTGRPCMHVDTTIAGVRVMPRAPRVAVDGGWDTHSLDSTGTVPRLCMHQALGGINNHHGVCVA